MNNPSEVYADDERSAGRRLDRGGAYRAAQRHSSRVRALRWAIPLGCVIAVAGLIGFTLFDPFSKIPGNFSIGAMGLSGTRVTMELPKLSGYRQDGRRYDVRAVSGVQDIKVPNVIELNQMDATFETAERSHIHVISPLAIYDSVKEAMQMRGDVRITSDTGFDIRLHNADVDMKAGTIVSREPVDVVMPRGTVLADQLQVVGGGQQVTFEGNVRTLLVPADGDSSARPGMGP